MRLAILALASGCGGAYFDWEARAVVGVEPQRVPAAALDPAASAAEWLSVRGETADIAYPLAREGADVVLTSAFIGGQLPVTYDPYAAPLVTKPASIIVPLHGPLADPPRDVEPGVTPFRAHLDVILLGSATDPVTVPIDLAPAFDPCANAWTSFDDQLDPVPPGASSNGAAIDQDSNSVMAAGFAVKIFIQLSCSVSAG